jgi:hypothetical protein
MLKKKLFYIALLILSGVFIISSCKKDEDNTSIPIKTDQRVFIVNEGPFQSGSGSLSIYYRDTEEVDNQVFEGVNGFALGNLVQSISVHQDKIYIVVNNAGRIEVAAKDELVSSGAIEGINLPRYFLGVDAFKAYVTSWDNKVYILDLNSNTISGDIATATGPEKMLQLGESVWVLNQGGLSIDSSITVIDISTDQVINSLIVGVKPTGIVQDKYGLVWVMCSGKGWNGFPGADDTRGKLVCIDPQDYSIIKTLEFPGTTDHPEKLVIDKAGEKIFFNYPGGLYSQDVSAQTLELNLVVSSPTMFYALGFDPVSGMVFTSNPLDYVQTGLVYRIDPDLNEKVDSFSTGIVPGEFCFN